MASGLGTLAGSRTTRPNYRVARKKSIIQSSVLFINDCRKKIHVIIIDYNQRGLWSPARTFNKTTCSWCASLSPLPCDSGKLGWRSKLALNTTYRHVSDGALEGLMSQTRQKHQIYAFRWLWDGPRAARRVSNFRVAHSDVGAYCGNHYLLWKVEKSRGKKNNSSARRHCREILSDRCLLRIKRKQSVRIDCSIISELREVGFPSRIGYHKVVVVTMVTHIICSATRSLNKILFSFGFDTVAGWLTSRD